MGAHKLVQDIHNVVVLLLIGRVLRLLVRYSARPFKDAVAKVEQQREDVQYQPKFIQTLISKNEKMLLTKMFV